MGLAHPHDSGGGSDVMDGVTSAFGDYGDFNLNQGIFTTMSYNDGWHTAPHVPELDPSSATYGYGWQGTLMALDIAVLQEKYGANMTYNTGDDTYQMPSSNAAGTFYSCIWDAGGTDTIRHDGTPDVRIDLRAATLEYTAIGGGAVSYVDGIYGGFTIANTVVIENAVGGSGDDVLRGNEAVNELNGRDGDDTYYVQQNGDTIIDSSGTDTVNSTVSFTLAANLEKCVLIGGASINATGNQFANTLTGNGAANQLNGGGGADRMIGNNGNDTYIVNQRQDIVVEYANGGRDSVRSTVDFTLGNNVEICSLLGSGNIDATGNALANTLRGNSGANLLDGGRGSDTMIGGHGNDVYVVNQRSDNVVESGRGTDTVRSSVDYLLDAGIERCYLIGPSGADATGNSLANTLRGNGGGNTLKALGGSDALKGGGGRDILVGGVGKDNLNGGTGADVFDFNSVSDSTQKPRGRDFIGDFSRKQGDKINLAQVDADGSLAGNGQFKFIGKKAFSSDRDHIDDSRAELRYFHTSNRDTIIQGDTDGDRIAEFSIVVDGRMNFTQGDFVL
jgi:serralysin